MEKKNPQKKNALQLRQSVWSLKDCRVKRGNDMLERTGDGDGAWQKSKNR